MILRLFKKIKLWQFQRQTLIKRINTLEIEVKDIHDQLDDMLSIHENVTKAVDGLLTEVHNNNKTISKHTSGLNTIVIGKRDDDN